MQFEYPKELMPWQINELRPEVVGLHAINPGLANNSPSRSTMATSHISQHQVIAGSELPYTLTGVEVEYRKYTTSERVPEDVRVFQVIDRYPPGISSDSIKFNPEKLIITVNDATGEYDAISVPFYKSYHQYFGYQNKLSDELNTLTPGKRLGKDTVLGDTPANVGQFHTMTVNLNCMLASPGAVAEDSVLLCEDVLPLFESHVYERRSVSVGSKKFAVNIGKDPDVYKAFYDIGEYTDIDGALMFTRSYTEGLSPVTMSRRTANMVDYTFDEPVYGRQGLRGRIVDIKVMGNSATISALPPAMSAQFEKYRKAYVRYFEELLAAERRIYAEAKTRFGTDRPKFSPRLHHLLVIARGHTDSNRSSPGGKSLQGLLNKAPLDEYHIEFVVEYKIRPTEGGKLTSYSGDPL